MPERPKVSGELFSTPEDQKNAQAIVDEMLGLGFIVDYDSLSKNVGVKGDARVYGHSVIITAGIETGITNPAKFLMERAEIFALLSNRICNETQAASRVVFEIAATQEPTRD